MLIEVAKVAVRTAHGCHAALAACMMRWRSPCTHLSGSQSVQHDATSGNELVSELLRSALKAPVHVRGCWSVTQFCTFAACRTEMR